MTGMSGVGKSAVLERLAAEGILCLDLDDGWMCEIQGEPQIDLAAVRQFVRSHPRESIVFAGCAINQGGLPVDAAILLTASTETMRERIAQRKNPFGKDEATWQKILKDKEEVEPVLKAKCDLVIHTEQALDETVAQIRLLLDPRPVQRLRHAKVRGMPSRGIRAARRLEKIRNDDIMDSPDAGGPDRSL